jgi:hypothetical protein
MKKFLKFLILGLVFSGMLYGTCLCANANTAKSKTLKTDIEAIRIPAGTTLKLELLEPVSSSVGSVGDEFSAMLQEDKIVNKKIALPAGSIVRGTINRIVQSKRISRSALVYLSFDHFVTPVGRQVPVSAGLYNYAEISLDGGIYNGGNYGYALKENWKTTKNIFNKAVNWGKGTGENLQYVCTPIAAIGGGFGAGAYYVGDAVVDLFKKGNEVKLHQGQQFSVMLSQPLDIPLH